MYHLYILRCKDGTLYTGITTNIERRVREHNTSTEGARYTKARRPVVLVYTKRYRTRSTASKAEYACKQLTKKQKLLLIDEFSLTSKKT